MHHIAVEDHLIYETCVDLEEDWGQHLFTTDSVKTFGQDEAELFMEDDLLQMRKYLWFMSDCFSLGWDPVKCTSDVPCGCGLMESMGYVSGGLKGGYRRIGLRYGTHRRCFN
jgi:hypothetical protein